MSGDLACPGTSQTLWDSSAQMASTTVEVGRAIDEIAYSVGSVVGGAEIAGSEGSVAGGAEIQGRAVAKARAMSEGSAPPAGLSFAL